MADFLSPKEYVMDMQPKATAHGIAWGPASMTCGFSDDSKGWVTFILSTKKHPNGIQVYVTKSGKVRVHSADGEWKPATPTGRTE